MKPKIVVAVIAALVIFGIIFLLLFGGCSRIEQDELAFKYNVMSGKPVSSEEDPLLPFGWSFKWGIHTKFFRVSSQSHQFTFCESTTEESPYDEAATFDSMEGTTMKVDYTISAKAGDVWEFYENYGQNQYAVPAESKGIKDPRIYEAIREAGAYVNVILPEITQAMPAAEIRRSFAKFNADLTQAVADYMKQFGLNVDQVILSGNFKYPAGNSIEVATARLGDKNSEVEKKQREAQTAEERKQQAIAEARIKAEAIISAAQIEAERLVSEAQAAVIEIGSLVKQVGKDKAVDLLISREIAELIRQGKVSESYISEKSLTGSLSTPK